MQAENLILRQKWEHTMRQEKPEHRNYPVRYCFPKRTLQCRVGGSGGCHFERALDG